MNGSFLQQQSRPVPENDWAIGVILVATLLYVMNRLIFPRYYARISHAYFNQYEATKLIEEKNILFNPAGFLLNLVPPFCIAMLVLYQRAWFHPDMLFESPFGKYLVALAAVVIYFGARIAFIQVMGFAFDKREVALRFNQVWLLQFENLGTFILVPALALPYLSGPVRLVFLLAVWVILAIWLLYTIIREIGILQSYRVSLFYLFLYLCTLEILPLWWVIQSITEGW